MSELLTNGMCIVCQHLDHGDLECEVPVDDPFDEDTDQPCRCPHSITEAQRGEVIVVFRRRVSES